MKIPQWSGKYSTKRKSRRGQYFQELVSHLGVVLIKINRTNYLTKI